MYGFINVCVIKKINKLSLSIIFFHACYTNLYSDTLVVPDPHKNLQKNFRQSHWLIFVSCSLFLSLSSRTSAHTVRSTRTNRSGKSRRLGSSFWLRPSTSWPANWKYVAAHRYTIFIGRARRSAPRRIGRGWYITSRPRLSSASTTCNRRRIFRPVRRNPTGKSEWKVKLLRFFLLRGFTLSKGVIRNKYVSRAVPAYLSKFEIPREFQTRTSAREFVCP